MYLDTCIEPWPGGYTDPTVPAGKRTNYALREEALALRTGNAARTDRGAHPRRQSRPGLALRQAGAAQHRRRHGGGRRQAGHARASGASWRAASASRSSTSPSATRRSPSNPKQPGEFVNTWSVDGFVSEGCAAGRDGLGHARAQLSARRQAPRLRLPGRHLPDAAGRGHARAHLDAARRTVPRLLHHARRVDLDRRLLHGARGLAGRLPAHRALRLSPVRCGGAVGARARRPQLRAAGAPAHPHGRHRRAASTSSACCSPGHKKNAYWYGSQLSIEEARKLAPYNNATSLQVHVGGAVRRHLGDGESEPAASSSRTRWTSAATSRSACRISARWSGEYTDWTPLHERERLFPEDIDKSDPWQFKNVRVIW